MRPATSGVTPNRRGVETAADVRRVLRRANVLARLAREVLHTMELATLEARVEALQVALKARTNPPNKERTT